GGRAGRGRLGWVPGDPARRGEDTRHAGLLPIWLRLKGGQALPPDETAAAFALVVWREETARTLDRPRRWIMSDELLLRVANLRPTSVSALRRIPEMPQRLGQRYGEQIVAALAARA